MTDWYRRELRLRLMAAASRSSLRTSSGDGMRIWRLSSVVATSTSARTVRRVRTKNAPRWHNSCAMNFQSPARDLSISLDSSGERVSSAAAALVGVLHERLTVSPRPAESLLSDRRGSMRRSPSLEDDGDARKRVLLKMPSICPSRPPTLASPPHAPRERSRASSRTWLTGR
jgi:hypothetical protein